MQQRFASTSSKIKKSRTLRFLFVGGLSFAIDFGLLIILHESVGLVLWAAAPLAFIASLIFNFLAQRTFTFAATNKVGAGAGKYAVLVAGNVVASSAIVTVFESVGFGYAVGKVTATALITVWNFLLYKYWVFQRTDTLPVSENDGPVSASGGSERHSEPR